MAELAWWLNYNPHIHWDPGPEVYKYFAELPPERQGPIISAINTARGELEATRAKGYAQIGAALAASGGGSGAKR
ncbi:hypothetical protein SAMN05519104_1141 [Rhizobiales bacterium GAS188]|nr:hypothetical protein SAMN05519104_1141 [Rhizobiales bacterium GAS188]